MNTAEITGDAVPRTRVSPRGEPHPPRAADRTLDGLVARVARRTPEAVAVREGTYHLTYAAVESRAARLATALLRGGLQLGDPVIVHCTDHRQTVVAHLAVLKAGGVCVPVPTDAPETATRRAAAVSGARIVVCGQSTRERWSPDHARIVLDCAETWQRISRVRVDLALPLSAPEEAAYLLVTGEDGGRAGGHLVDHRAWRLALAARTRYAGAVPHTVAVAERPGGARALAALWWAAAGGGTLAVQSRGPGHAGRPGSHGGGAVLYEPEAYQRALDALDPTGIAVPPSLVILVGGAVSAEVVARHFRLFPGTQLWSEFAPADGVLPWTARQWTAVQPSPDTPRRDGLRTVGAPVSDVRLTVVDGEGHPLDPGEVGGVCVTGPATAFDVLDAGGRAISATPGPATLRWGVRGRLRTDGEVEILPREDRVPYRTGRHARSRLALAPLAR